MKTLNSTNDPTGQCDIVTNEATDASDVGPDGPTYMYAPTLNSTNEATGTCDSVTDEASADRLIVTYEATADDEDLTNEPTLICDVGLERPTYMEALMQAATNEPVLFTPSEGRHVDGLYLRGARAMFCEGIDGQQGLAKRPRLTLNPEFN